MVVQIKGEIDGSQAALLRRALEEAADKKAQAVLVEIDTFGGRVDSAVQMRDALVAASMPTICHIKNRAWSAGALIALAHKHIVISPGGSIGAAEPIPATEKSIAAIKAEFAATAHKTGRNPRVAEAMVDKTMGLPGYAEPGQIVALTDYQAEKVGYAEAVVTTREEVLEKYGLTGAAVQEYNMTASERAVGFLTEPSVRAALVSVIILAIMTEIKTAGTGVAGALGAGAALLFFGSQWMTGGAGLLEVLLFVGGLFLIVVELSVPGVGISGITGVVMILASLVLALGGGIAAVNTIALGILGAIGVFLLIARKLPSSKLWSRVVLQNQENDQAGFVSAEDYSGLLGSEGVVAKQLHPSGIVVIDERQVDVVSEGQFVEAGTKVRVIQVTGNKIVVRPI